MANTSVTYAADGVSTGPYTIPFPYIAQSHVKCKVDGSEVLNPSIWYFATDSTVVFRNAVPDGSAIYFYRETPGDTRLVDFVNGAVLTEADLDLAIDQVFYLAQEAKENYATLVNNETFRIGTSLGITETDPDLMIASLVDTLLADAAAATLQAAVGDIELNGEVILDIQTKLDGSIEVIDLIGAFNADESAFLLDTTKVKLGTLDTDPTFASKITTLEAADATNSASITTINTVTIPGVQADADAAQSDATAALVDTAALEARYGVALNVNGYVTGFVQNNDGTSGTFVVLADKFAIVDPSGDPAETEFVPFSVSGGVVTMQNVQINGNLVVDGTIDNDQMANKAVTDVYVGTATASTEVFEGVYNVLDSFTVTTGANDVVEMNGRTSFLNTSYVSSGNLTFRWRRFNGATPIQIIGATDTRKHDESASSGDYLRVRDHYVTRFEKPGAGTWTYKFELYIPTAMSGSYYAQDYQIWGKHFKKAVT